MDGSVPTASTSVTVLALSYVIKSMVPAAPAVTLTFLDLHVNTSVTVTLNTTIPLTWVRVVVNDAAYLNQIQLSYQLTSSSPLQACTSSSTAKVDDITADITCSTENAVSRLTLSGLGVTKLCSLYISGGRNVALKQATQQSSRYKPAEAPDSFKAENAVDGRVGDVSRDDVRLTCTHTDAAENDPDWWTVNFTQAADVTRFLVYNRDDACCNHRLENFKLTALSGASTDTPFTYNEPGTTRALYTVVPSPRISFPVSQVRFDLVSPNAILTLCEVLVYGGLAWAVSASVTVSMEEAVLPTVEAVRQVVPPTTLERIVMTAKLVNMELLVTWYARLTAEETTLVTEILEPVVRVVIQGILESNVGQVVEDGWKNPAGNSEILRCVRGNGDDKHGGDPLNHGTHAPSYPKFRK
ncbi:fibrinogen-related molecule [Elysia marginata]|uniref:Fibrinogen-related molecule n=1 Tax=Elysia marginata TaxID=1093978 RepID=A0AAV4FVT4_9GAST|nr:fibrinogen-related molecule [Elysia marginata]